MSEFHYVRTRGADGGVDACEGPAIGLDLETVLKDGLPPWNVALEVVAALCEILDIADEDGEVHGDVHPKYVFIDETGAVSLEGFGVKRKKGRAPGKARDTRSDLYGLGYTAFRVFCDHPLPDTIPTESSAHDEMVVDAALAVDLTGVPDAMQGDIQWYLAKLMEFEPGQRPRAVEAWRTFVAFANGTTGVDMAEWCAAALDGGGARRAGTQPTAPSPRTSVNGKAAAEISEPIYTPTGPTVGPSLGSPTEDLTGPRSAAIFPPVGLESSPPAPVAAPPPVLPPMDAPRVTKAPKREDEDLQGLVVQKGPMSSQVAFDEAPKSGGATAFWTRDSIKKALELEDEGKTPAPGGGSATAFWTAAQLAAMQRGGQDAPRPRRAEGEGERRRSTAGQRGNTGMRSLPPATLGPNGMTPPKSVREPDPAHPPPTPDSSYHGPLDPPSGPIRVGSIPAADRIETDPAIKGKPASLPPSVFVAASTPRPPEKPESKAGRTAGSAPVAAPAAPPPPPPPPPIARTVAPVNPDARTIAPSDTATVQVKAQPTPPKAPKAPPSPPQRPEEPEGGGGGGLGFVLFGGGVAAFAMIAAVVAVLAVLVLVLVLFLPGRGPTPPSLPNVEPLPVEPVTAPANVEPGTQPTPTQPATPTPEPGTQPAPATPGPKPVAPRPPPAPPKPAAPAPSAPKPVPPPKPPPKPVPAPPPKPVPAPPPKPVPTSPPPKPVPTSPPPKPVPSVQPTPPPVPVPSPSPKPKPEGSGTDARVTLRSGSTGTVSSCVPSKIEFSGQATFTIDSYLLPATCLVTVEGARGVFQVYKSGNVSCDKQGTVVLCDKSEIR